MAGGITVRWSGGERTFDSSEVVTLGRDPSNTIVLTHGSISRRHAELRHGQDGWTFVDLRSTQGSHADGSRISSLAINDPSTIVLGHPEKGDRIQLAPSSDVVTEFAQPDDGPTLPAGSRPGGPLAEDEVDIATVVTGPTLSVSCAGVSRTLRPGQSVVIGRDQACDIVSNNPVVSRRHAVVSHNGNAWTIEDLGSSRGSFIQGRRIHAMPLSGAVDVSLGAPDAGETVALRTKEEPHRVMWPRPPHPIRRRLKVVVAASLVATIIASAFVLADRLRTPGRDPLAHVTVKILTERSSGSGTIIDAKRGLILTNAHVAEPRALGQAIGRGTAPLPESPKVIRILMAPSIDKPAVPRFLGTVVVADGYLDLAVVKITSEADGGDLTPASLSGLTEAQLGDSDAVRSGGAVQIAGYSGVAESGAMEVTKGIITAAVPDERLATDRAWLNVDADIAAGTSGGLAVDGSNRMIGVASAPRVGVNAGRVRPINLAAELIAKARGGEPYSSPFVTPLSGKEEIGDVLFTVPTSANESFESTPCRVTTESVAPGASSISITLGYAGFPIDAHQDMLVAVLEGTSVAGLVETNDQYPFKWAGEACIHVAVPLKRPLTGPFSVRILFGPNYELQVACAPGPSALDECL